MAMLAAGRDSDSGKEPHHKSPALDDVTKRNKRKNADRIADLRGDSDGSHLAVIGMQAVSHLQQKRLVVIDIRDANTACQTKKGQQTAVLRVQINWNFRGDGRDVFQTLV
jgi:hypothetical protein